MGMLYVRMMLKRRLSLLALLTAAAGCTNGQSATVAKVSTQALAGAERLPHWSEKELVAPSPEAFLSFNSVAIASGLSLASIYVDPNDNGFSGTVIPYHQIGKDWIQETPLLSDDLEQTRGFGVAVAVSSTDAVVSGLLLNSSSGAVWPFARTAGAWAPKGPVISPPADASGDQSAFGFSLALDADTLVVGSVLTDGSDSGGPVPAQGAAYVYTRKPQGWQFEETLRPTGATTASSSFGYAVAISGDLVAVGAPDEVGSDGEPDGAVYVFQRSSETGTWSTGQRFVAATPSASSFGKSVALGVTRATASAVSVTRFAVGAPDGDDDAGGLAYTYEQTATGWSNEVRLTDPDGVGGRFGRMVGFATDKLFVSAPSANTGLTGHVQAFGLGTGLPPLGNLVLDSQPDDATTTVGITMAVLPSSALILSAAPGVYVYSPEQGQSCDSSAGCATGYCSDGVCCDTACTGTCQSCLAADKKDRKNDGTCGLVAADVDPRDDCKAGSSICGMTGVCDGAGACALRAAGAACDDARCSTRTAFVGSSSCDGQGHCAPPKAQTCDAGFVCEGGACATTCTDNTECDAAHGFYCFNEACVTGPRCSADHLSAYSAAGVISDCSPSLCKNNACETQCKANTDCQAGHACQKGVCTASCSDTSDCDMAGGYYCFENLCVTGPRCSTNGDTAYGTAGEDTKCAPFSCKNGVCLAHCSTSDDCAPNSVCDQSSNCVDMGQLSGSGSHISSSSCSIGFHRSSSLGWLCTLGFATWLAARRRNSGKSRSRRLTE